MRSRKYQKSCSLQRLPGQGGLESYISNQTAGCFTSQTVQPAFLSFTILHTSLYSFPFCSKQPFHISRKGKKNILLIQNLWNKHLSGTHCCWLLFRWCICREDHQSNSRLQLVQCCSLSCFCKNTAYKQMVTNKKQKTPLLLNADRIRKHRKWEHYELRNW